jgi:DNA-binding transcriptional ArsR family regulator
VGATVGAACAGSFARVVSEADADVYAAIADPTRRRMLTLLHGREMSVSELAAGFPVTRPAISQHLALLRASGLVTFRKDGRTRYYSVRPAPLGDVIDWLGYFDTFWDDRLGQLKSHLAADE